MTHSAVPHDDLQPMTVRGDIWDSTCAAAGSHGKMMARTQAKDVKECTLACVKGGAQLVLYNTDDKTIYRLDSQDKVKQYAGQTVTVIGNYDRATDVLHVDRIETGM
jgi:BRCT domain type II-containing protein